MTDHPSASEASSLHGASLAACCAFSTPMQLGLLLFCSLLSIFLLFLTPSSLMTMWSQPLVVDGFHHDLLLLQFIVRDCLLVRAPFHLPVHIFPFMPFPCFSQVSKPSSSQLLPCQAAAKVFFFSSVYKLKIPPRQGRLLFAFDFPPALLPLLFLKCISPSCLMCLQQPPKIQAELLDGSHQQLLFGLRCLHGMPGAKSISRWQLFAPL